MHAMPEPEQFVTVANLGRVGGRYQQTLRSDGFMVCACGAAINLHDRSAADGCSHMQRVAAQGRVYFERDPVTNLDFPIFVWHRGNGRTEARPPADGDPRVRLVGDTIAHVLREAMVVHARAMMDGGQRTIATEVLKRLARAGYQLVPIGSLAEHTAARAKSERHQRMITIEEPE
jgi:hypothetical protein